MNKTLRNRALKNSSQLITAELNGEAWPAPDGYFATAYPIYDGYTVKKSQQVQNRRPNLGRILPKCNYTEVELLTEDVATITVTAGELRSYTIQRVYYELLMSIYPTAIAKIATSGDKYAPVELHDNNTLVAVIMPLRS